MRTSGTAYRLPETLSGWLVWLRLFRRARARQYSPDFPAAQRCAARQRQADSLDLGHVHQRMPGGWPAGGLAVEQPLAAWLCQVTVQALLEGWPEFANVLSFRYFRIPVNPRQGAGRRCLGTARTGAGTPARHPAPARKAGLLRLRSHCAGGGAQPSDHSTGSAGLCDERSQGPWRRYAAARADPGQRQDEDRTAVDLRAR